jgi:hypothetical protein
LAYRQRDDALGLAAMMGEALADLCTSRNKAARICFRAHARGLLRMSNRPARVTS